MQFRYFIGIFTLIALEVLLRVFGINETYKERIGLDYSSYYGQKMDSWYWTHTANSNYVDSNNAFTYYNHANSLGHREMEPEQVFRDSAIRVFVLGDSFTEGFGAPYESSFVRQLQAIINRPSEIAHCYNAGTAGSDPYFDFVLLRDKLLKYHPDIVVQTFNSSDYYDFILRGGFERFLPDSTTAFKSAPWFEPLYHHCYLFRLISGYGKKRYFTDEAEKTNRQFLSLADSFRVLSEKYDFKLYFMVLPAPHEFVTQSPLQLATLLRENGHAAINAWEPMSKVINKSNLLLYSHVKDGHYNAAGYLLLAESIMQETDKKYPGLFSDSEFKNRHLQVSFALQDTLIKY